MMCSRGHTMGLHALEESVQKFHKYMNIIYIYMYIYIYIYLMEQTPNIHLFYTFLYLLFFTFLFQGVWSELDLFSIFVWRVVLHNFLAFLVED